MTSHQRKGKDRVTPTLKDVWREMRTRSMSYAKNFALVGLVFSTVECNIEFVRRTRHANERFFSPIDFSIERNRIFAMAPMQDLSPVVYSVFEVRTIRGPCSKSIIVYFQQVFKRESLVQSVLLFSPRPSNISCWIITENLVVTALLFVCDRLDNERKVLNSRGKVHFVLIWHLSNAGRRKNEFV